MIRALLRCEPALACVAMFGIAVAQVPPRKEAPHAAAGAAESAAQLSESGHCREALPLLKSAMTHSAGLGQKKRLGLDAVRCAMSLDDADTALDFVRTLKRLFPRDPDVLYVAVHVFSDLSVSSSKELSQVAPGSFQARELNAEAMEAQGKPEEAVQEYREVLKKEPNLRGIHYRIGRLLLSGPNKEMVKDEARREFEAELKIDPSSAAAEYVLGEMARQDQQTSAAVEHFSRATKLDAGFTDAFIGLGRSLIEGGHGAEAIPPLQSAARLQPDNPAVHFYLGTAYQRSGRAEEAKREFALQQQATEKLQRNRQEKQAVTAGSEKAGESRKEKP